MPDPNRLENIFLAASELPEAERSAYLNEACGVDAELRGAVDRLLSAHADPASILKPHVVPLPSTVPHAPEPDAGTTLAGRYTLLEEIGEGGMGTVWMARQTEPVKRMVALKLIKPGMDSKAVLARFESERQALALMDHPNIARVLDGGVTAYGRPFFVMDLVKGVPITKYCDARKLTPRERLELFVPVCHAIQHAHQKGIIHRDIKPSNVLVAMFDDRPIPKVIDFGVAKATGQPLTEQTFHTGFGTVIGTPQYMSPEQATFNNLDVDTRSDLYSLGVLLYELLAGSPPFTGKELEQAGVLDMMRVVREEEPPRPSTRLSTADALPTLAANRSTEPKKLTGMLRRELDWIVMKALEKDRTRRYETANGFAADVLRYLSGEPVQAVPPSVGYRLRKFVRKNRWPVTAAAMVVLVLIGAGVAAFQFQRTLARTELDAEKKRLEDLRLADETARREQEAARRKQEATRRETRATALGQSLPTADTGKVPRLIEDLAEFHDLTGLQLRELAKQAASTKAGLHARLALLADEPGLAGEVAAYLPSCKPEELLTIREYLKPHAAVVAPALWGVLYDEKADSRKRVQAACGLAGLTPDDPRWAKLVPLVIETVVHATPGEFVVWSQALEPVRGTLLPALVKRYPTSRERIRSGKLDETDLVTEVLGFDLTVNLLAKYAANLPVDLADLAMTVDPRHYALISEAIEKNQAAVIPILKAELAKTFDRDWKDSAVESLAVRQADAAAALLKLKQADLVWPLFQHRPDPRVRSYLIHRLGPLGANAKAVINRLDKEPDVTIRRALLQSLGEYGEKDYLLEDRKALLPKLQEMYRTATDPGIHASSEWLLRTWKEEAWLKQVNDDWAKDKEQREKRLEGIGKALVKDKEKTPPQWYVNGQGQTFVVIPGPVEFVMGSPLTEADRSDVELQHKVRIGRTFTLAASLVTKEQFLRFLPKFGHNEMRRYPDPTCPIGGVVWYEAVAYCNWLSKEEGIDEDQWCYDIKGQVTKLKENYLSLTGYRLPTEAEMECATRAGALTSRYFGESDELLPKYAWYNKNAQERTWPVGSLKPNDLGLFDVQGNVFTWCQESYKGYPQGEEVSEDKEDVLTIVSAKNRVLRGGSFAYPATNVRSSLRFSIVPSTRFSNVGIRLARTFIP